MRKQHLDANHPQVFAARQRVLSIIDAISPADLVSTVKETPSLRGMIAGNIAEFQFRKYVESLPELSDFYKPDDHDRKANKVDLMFKFRGQNISVQLKSIQTNSIKWDPELKILRCGVQNDGSDRRMVRLPNGHEVETTNYKFGDYDILAVPLFPFTGAWDFAYLLNEYCHSSTYKKYSAEDKPFLIATMEPLTYPISGKWSTDIFQTIAELIDRRQR